MTLIKIMNTAEFYVTLTSIALVWCRNEESGQVCYWSFQQAVMAGEPGMALTEDGEPNYTDFIHAVADDTLFARVMCFKPVLKLPESSMYNRSAANTGLLWQCPLEGLST